MNAHDHLQMLINRAYFENYSVYRALMAQMHVEIKVVETKRPEKAKFPMGMTVKELKAIVSQWPETDANGEPTEVWLETGNAASSPCQEVWPLNMRSHNGAVWADLLLCPPDKAWPSDRGSVKSDAKTLLAINQTRSQLGLPPL